MTMGSEITLQSSRSRPRSHGPITQTACPQLQILTKLTQRMLVMQLFNGPNLPGRMNLPDIEFG